MRTAHDLRLILLAGAVVAAGCSTSEGEGGTDTDTSAETGTTTSDAEPGPGQPGGLCLAPAGHCEVGECNRDENYCFNPAAPCEGFSCGGSERGTCVPAADAPSCVCEPGYENQTFALYCCPEPGSEESDPNCPA